MSDFEEFDPCDGPYDGDPRFHEDEWESFREAMECAVLDRLVNHGAPAQREWWTLIEGDGREAA